MVKPVIPAKGELTGALPEGNDGLGFAIAWALAVQMFCLQMFMKK